MTSFEAVVEEEQIEWGKFYPKKVIQIVGVKLSTQISDVKFFIQKSYPKKILSKDLLDLFYVTLYKRSPTFSRQYSIRRKTARILLIKDYANSFVIK